MNKPKIWFSNWSLNLNFCAKQGFNDVDIRISFPFDIWIYFALGSTFSTWEMTIPGFSIDIFGLRQIPIDQCGSWTDHDSPTSGHYRAWVAPWYRHRKGYRRHRWLKGDWALWWQGWKVVFKTIMEKPS